MDMDLSKPLIWWRDVSAAEQTDAVKIGCQVVCVPFWFLFEETADFWRSMT